MKSIYKLKYVLGAFLLAGTAGCTEVVDGLTPEDDLAPSVVFSDPVSAESVLIGAYSNLTEGAYDVTVHIAELQTNNIRFGGSFTTYQEIRDGIINSANGTFATWFNEYYQLINRANLVIENLPSTPGLSPDQLAEWTAEARFLRAVAHFELLKLFGDRALLGSTSDANLGVPIITTSFQDGFSGPQLLPARSTNGDVWDFVISELTAARADLPVGVSTRATQGAADAFLARAYLYRRQYANAATSANNVISSGAYALGGTAATADYNTLNNSSVFTIYRDANNNPGVNSAVVSFFRPTPGRGDMVVDTLSLNALFGAGIRTTTDTRYQFPGLIDTIANRNRFSRKFVDATSLTDFLPMVRYEDVVLMRAEALQQQSGSPDAAAITLLNSVAAARQPGFTNLTTGDFATAQAVIDRILLERRKEFLFEGIYRFDLVRTGQNVTNFVGTISGDLLNFPIPFTALDQNPNLEQNPGY